MPSAGRGTTVSSGPSAQKSPEASARDRRSSGKLQRAELVATEAARILGITGLLAPDAPNPKGILDHFERCEKFVREEDFKDPDAEFSAVALEIVDELIDLATTEARLREAVRWVTESWPASETKGSQQRDPVALLAVLTLLYIARAGSEFYHDDPGHAPLWASIRERVQTLLF